MFSKQRMPSARPPELPPKVDATQIEGLGTAVEAAKEKLSTLDMTVTPHVQQGRTRGDGVHD
jgi:hypothetical protein